MSLSLQTDESTSIGEAIRLLRKEKRISQENLAREVRVARSTIVRIERGVSKSPPLPLRPGDAEIRSALPVASEGIQGKEGNAPWRPGSGGAMHLKLLKGLCSGSAISLWRLRHKIRFFSKWFLSPQRRSRILSKDKTMKQKAAILINIVGAGFLLNGIFTILFRNWIQNVLHFPVDELIFPLLEIAAGFIILFRWRLSKVVGRFSRIAGLLYAGFALLVAILLPFLGKEFQYLSVKILDLIYFCFYLFCLSVLSNQSVKSLFPSVEERVYPVVFQVRNKLVLDKKMIQRISFWVKLIAILLIIDSILLSILSYGLKPYPGMNA